MDKVSAGVILVIVFVMAVAGVLVFNPLNPSTSPVNTAIITGNQTGNNTPNTDTLPSSNTLLTFIPYLLDYNNPSSSSVNHSPGPEPANDTMDNVIRIFDAYVKTNFPKTGIPGMAVVIVQNNKIIYMNCLGVRDVESGELVNANTLFQLASCTKAFTSTNVAQLVDQGLLSWNTKITEYYPDPAKFKLYDDVTNELTLSDVLVQRVGLPANSGDEFGLFNYTSYDDGLYKLRYFKNISEFRTTFTYNNILYSLAGECAARATNTEWSELIKKDLLEPLGMTNSVTTYNDFINSQDRIHTYIHIDDVLQEREPLNPNNLPAGVISSSIGEIANWLAFQIRDDGTFQGKQIVSKDNLDVTRTGHIYRDSSNTTMYGMGWIVDEDGISHAGSEFYSNSYVEIFKSQNIGIAVFSNEGTFGTAFEYALSMKLKSLLKGDTYTDPWPYCKELLVQKPTLPNATEPIIPPKILSTYTGIYSNTLFGNITITTDNNSLICYYGNDNQPFNLIHWNGDVFEEKNYNQAFNFTDINNGSAHHLTTNILDYSTEPLTPAVFNHTNST